MKEMLRRSHYQDALLKIAQGNYDNAHDCKAAARIASEALRVDT